MLFRRLPQAFFIGVNRRYLPLPTRRHRGTSDCGEAATGRRGEAEIAALAVGRKIFVLGRFTAIRCK